MGAMLCSWLFGEFWLSGSTLRASSLHHKHWIFVSSVLVDRYLPGLLLVFAASQFLVVIFLNYFSSCPRLLWKL